MRPPNRHRGGAAGGGAGNAEDVEVGADSTIYILDSFAPAVRVFVRTADTCVRSVAVGREFRRPQQLIVAPDGRLWVFDATARVGLVLPPDGTELARSGSGEAIGPTPLTVVYRA